MSLLRSALREPLLHFLLLGAMIFGFYAVVAPSEPPTSQNNAQEIQVTTPQVDRLAAAFEATWRRPPTEEERASLIAQHVKEEILVRAALGLAMDEGDPIIRGRLAQKMQFLIESTASVEEPSDQMLNAFFADNANRYATAPLIGFEQIYFGAEAEAADVQRAIAELNAGADPEAYVAPTLLPRVLVLSPRPAVDGTFGTGVFDELLGLEDGLWEGPIRSGYGIHAFRVTERRSGGVPDLASVRHRVEADWRAHTAERRADEVFDEMRERYIVVLPERGNEAGLTQ